MLLIYRRETALKTGYLTTEDLIPPNGGRYKPARSNHPEAQRAQTVMNAMGSYFHNTDRTRRIPLREAFQGACALHPDLASFAKYLPATKMADERILVQAA